MAERSPAEAANAAGVKHPLVISIDAKRFEFATRETAEAFLKTAVAFGKNHHIRRPKITISSRTLRAAASAARREIDVAIWNNDVALLF